MSDRLESWENEEVVDSAELFFSRLGSDIEAATTSIEIESYIYDNDDTGARITQKLIEASMRGVRIRVMVDGFGSPLWVLQVFPKLAAAGIPGRVYHPLPWSWNKRNHRKMFIIDGRVAWVGGMNVSSSQYQWRDTMARVSGPGVKALRWAFERTWLGIRFKVTRFGRYPDSSVVHLNSTYRLRHRKNAEFIRRISQAVRRVWITNAYFVPNRRLIQALVRAVRNGADVQLIVAGKSDVFFMPWITAAYYKRLLKAGIRIFEYRACVLHAKTLLADDWTVVGSSNLNHRSIIHDLEVDVVLEKVESCRELENQFQADLKQSREVTLPDLSKRSLLNRLAGRILLYLRYWI